MSETLLIDQKLKLMEIAVRSNTPDTTISFYKKMVEAIAGPVTEDCPYKKS